MPDLLAHLRSKLRRTPDRPDEACASGSACSWDALRTVYEEQAERGVPEAVAGLRLIEQDRWPTSGRSR